ncbi:MAG: ATP-binding cassette domain-containing protein, partial [Lachnospiraceae bacterium]|nr:ATP-binding cassette domain-containing protein [Lachnospiraceae bacterium]
LRGADILILDEPTAVLTPQETVEIFEELKRLKELGHTVVFISHKLGEIKEICDRITIMRDGRTIGVRMVDEVSEQEISRLMIGRDVLLKTDKAEAKPGKAFLSISNLNYTDAAGQKILNDINMTVRKGEILGIAGIEGNGQNELSELVTGMKKNRAGQILIDGEDISRKSVREIRELGVSHISQDRMTYGVVADAGVADNIMADRYYRKEFKKGVLLNRKKICKETDQLILEYGVKCDDREQPVRMLSGGNMQKVVVAREFSSDPKLVIANQPTRGIDVGAAEFVHKKLLELRDKDAAILLISADLTEIINLSDSIVVLHDGAIVAYFEDAKTIDPVELGEYMLGIKKMSQEQIGGAVHEQ